MSCSKVLRARSSWTGPDIPRFKWLILTSVIGNRSERWTSPGQCGTARPRFQNAQLPGTILHELWEPMTKNGIGYKVFTLFYKGLRDSTMDPHESPLPEPLAQDPLTASAILSDLEQVFELLSATKRRHRRAPRGSKEPRPSALRGRFLHASASCPSSVLQGPENSPSIRRTMRYGYHVCESKITAHVPHPRQGYRPRARPTPVAACHRLPLRPARRASSQGIGLAACAAPWDQVPGR